METLKDGTIVEFLNDKDQKLAGEIKLYNPIGDFYLVQAEINGNVWCVPSERIIRQWS